MSGQEEGAAATLRYSDAKFSVVDYTMFSLMLVVSVGIGVYCAIKSRHNTTTQEYLLGSRKMSPWPVSLSLLGGFISAISILGNATEVYLYGTQLCVMLLGLIPGCVLVYHVIIPVFYNLKIVSVSEFAFNDKLLTVCQLLMKFFYMGICLYTPSLALSTVTNLTTTASMAIMGAVCTVYITIGGVKAVVYTDVMQTLLMFGGVLLVVIISCIDLGGVGNIWAEAEKGSRIEFFNLDTSPFVRHTFWSTIVLGFNLMLNSMAFNQSSYQRLASVSTLKVAQSTLQRLKRNMTSRIEFIGLSIFHQSSTGIN
ncbi:sodium-dependent multivitamin transporter [Cherax quadricarinatus]|uniref:sodium-dependent multivitamin transporter n=1 Tax=Cherax quadricarinatus TaxID=27406 RepID=UPI00387E6E90